MKLNRPYYHCKSCGEGSIPRDRTLRLSSRFVTPGAEEVTTLCGTLVSFVKGSERTLHRLSGLRLSESTVRRITEDSGSRLREMLEQGQSLGEYVEWTWSRDHQGRTCGYVSLDATGIPQQGPGGEKAEGRMAYVAKLYSPAMQPGERSPEDQVRYLGGLLELNALGTRLRRQAAQVGWDRLDQQIAISDGGAGLEDFFRVHFPRAECILDFWHAKEHLVEFSQAWFGSDQQRQRWLSEQCHRLKHEGGQAVLDQLNALELKGSSAEAREAHRQHTGYFRNHVHRMDYPRYLARGWQIGSGPVEAACKTVVAERLKCSGMRWSEDGSDAVTHLRALYLSESSQWSNFWRHHPN